MGESAIEGAIKVSAAKAKIIKPVSPHVLRHSYATGLMGAGVDMLTISRLLGHASFTTTMIYLHVRQPHLNSTPSPLDWRPVTHVALRFEVGQLSNRYLHGPAVDQILADEQVSSPSTAGDVLWPLTDNLGSVRDLAAYNAGTDVTTIANHIAYDAFGQRTSETNSAVDHLFGYTGRDWDDDADLQYNRARWYDPVTGRWMSQDPIGFNAGDANLYRYVGNGPTTKIDPTGLWEWGDWIWILSPVGRPDDVVNTYDSYRDTYHSGKINRRGMDHETSALELNDWLDKRLKDEKGIAGKHVLGGLEELKKVAGFCYVANTGRMAGGTLRTGRGPSVYPSGRVAPVSGLKAGQRVNLPAWKKIKIDMEEVASGHMKGGKRLAPGNKKDLFPEGMTEKQVDKAIRDAYRNGELIRSQGDRVLIRGKWGGGYIEMWVNKVTKTIETAYPKF